MVSPMDISMGLGTFRPETSIWRDDWTSLKQRLLGTIWLKGGIEILVFVFSWMAKNFAFSISVRNSLTARLMNCGSNYYSTVTFSSMTCFSIEGDLLEEFMLLLFWFLTSILISTRSILNSESLEIDLFSSVPEVAGLQRCVWTFRIVSSSSSISSWPCCAVTLCRSFYEIS